LELFTNAPINGAHIGTYSLRDGYLLHYETEKDGPIMWIFKDGKLDDNKVSGTIPVNKCKCFEHGDKIYLLDGSRYMVISDNVLSDVEGYVPISYTVDVQRNRFSVEPLNILSETYKERYFWDGITNPYGKQEINRNDGKNYAIKKSNIVTDLSDYEYIQQYTDATLLLRHKQTNRLWYGVYYNYFTEIKLIDTGIVTKANTKVVSSQTTKTIVYWSTTNNFYFREYLGSGAWDTTDKNPWWSPNDDAWGLADDDCFWMLDDSGFNYHYILSESSEHSLVTVTKETVLSVWYTKKYYVKEFKTNIPFVWESTDLTTPTTRYVAIPTSDDLNTFYTNALTIYDVPTTAKGHFTKDTNIYYVCWSETDRDVLIIGNIDSGTYERKYYPLGFISRFLRISTDKNIIYWIDNEDNLWVSQLQQTDDYYDTLLDIKGDILFNEEFNYILSSENEPFTLYFWDKDSSYVETTIEITPNTEGYNEWHDRRQKFFKSMLHTRFDNNHWVSTHNVYFRSRGNDATYFPVSEYNELGDGAEAITGFNLANDTTLIAYSPSRTFLIQSFHSDTTGDIEYTITESKNTVGNTAIDAPIVTTLTEIPIQINNDGIYGLSQIANVSAVERIADLMSESINERWLNIDDKLISNIKTLNRLYWTYIIIPDEKNSHTMIYLLDNRTNSWYYWELPIVVVNAFIKDNRVEFVDINGNIYYLTSTDIENKAFDTQLVTEYYDAGKTLIPWYWQSQISPMGTMNYSKRLVNTTFILTDTDDKDGYGLNYSFKVFRKLASSVPEKEITGDLTLVRSLTTKTNISKFGFLQIKLSNITEDSQGTEVEKAYRNNKLRLVGLGLKYVLLEGLIR
jgi:hypothetical protein